MWQSLEELRIPVWNLYGGGMEIRGAGSVSWDEIMKQNYLHASRFDPLTFALKLQRESAFSNVSFKSRPRLTHWISRLSRAGDRISYKPCSETYDRQKAFSMIKCILVGLDREPLLKPFLINEMLNLSGVFHANNRFGREEHRQCRQILKKMTIKVKEIDRSLAPPAPLH